MRQLPTALFLTAFYFSFAQTPKPIIYSLFSGANGLHSKWPDVGVVIGVYAKGQTFYCPLGTRTVGGAELMDTATVFEIGSATKTFTALLLAEAIQTKKVGRNDFIDPYLPKRFHLSVALKSKIRLTDLASHQSGLPNLSSDAYFTELLAKDPRNPFRFVNKTYLYNVLRQTDSLNGYASYRYNNYAFSLLGDLLSRIYRKSYADLIRERILMPLRMKNTTLSSLRTHNTAGLYNQQGEPQDYLILDAVNPAGGLKSNAVDLLKYLKAYLSNTHYAKAVGLTRQTFYKDEKSAVGLGWDIKGDAYQKDGDTFGNSMLMRYNPEKQLAVVVLLNHQNGQLARDFMDAVYERLNK